MKFKILILSSITINILLLYWGSKRINSEFIEKNYITRDELNKNFIDKYDYSQVIDVNKYDNSTFLIYGLASRESDKIQSEYKDYGLKIKAVCGCKVSKVNVLKWDAHNKNVIDSLNQRIGNSNDIKVNNLKSYKINIP